MYDRTIVPGLRDKPFGIKKKEWKFETLHDLHLTANSLLRQAMLQERSKRWKKVIELYKELLWVINTDNMPADYEPPSNYSMLMYELHYHMGVAFQHLGQQKKAIAEFSRAIEDVSIPKNGCLAGCLMNSCLMTPLYARRAFAHARLEMYRAALKDAEKAVVLDSRSPDVYCIRALVRSTFDDELLGIKDLDIALKLNPDHFCANMLKACFTRPLVADQTNRFGFYGKSERFVESEETYLTCNSFSHPCVLEFYDKFLFPLSVPHTITVINLTPEKPSKTVLENNPEMYKKSSDSRPSSGSSIQVTGNGGEVFRCGTAGSLDNNKLSLRRRVDYSNAIRKYMSRPKSASEFFSELEKRRKREALIERAKSAATRPSARSAPTLARPSTQPETNTKSAKATFRASTMCDVRPSTAATKMTSSVTTNGAHRPKTSLQPPSFSPIHSPLLGNSTPYPRNENEEKENKEPKPKSALKKKRIIIETPTTYTIPVFQPVNIKCAPRMYYRPWIGDKLPATEKKFVHFAPVFK